MIYMRNYIARLHLHIHFSDHILKCFRVIAKNVTISFKHDYRRPTLSSHCDVISDVIVMEFIIVDVVDHLSVYDVKSCLYWKLRNFQNKGNLRSKPTFFSKVSPEVRHVIWLASLMPYILIDVLAQILVKLQLFKKLTCLSTWWRHWWRHKSNRLKAQSHDQGTSTHTV